MNPRSDSLSIDSTRDALIERCYELYRDEYLRVFPSGGDVQDHDEATYSAVAAVVDATLSFGRKLCCATTTPRKEH